MHAVNRKRNRAVTVRMNEAEYADLQNRVKESGLTQQSYIIGAVSGSTIMPAEAIGALKDISMICAYNDRQLRGMATNINQIARIVNGQGIIPSEMELAEISTQIADFRKENEAVWQSIRSSIKKQSLTEP